jgi:hypothetical protein
MVLKLPSGAAMYGTRSLRVRKVSMLQALAIERQVVLS